MRRGRRSKKTVLMGHSRQNRRAGGDLSGGARKRMITDDADAIRSVAFRQLFVIFEVVKSHEANSREREYVERARKFFHICLTSPRRHARPCAGHPA